MSKFKEPVSLEEARSRRAAITATTKEIQALLSNLAIGKDGSGQRIPHTQVVAARADALRVLRAHENELMFVRNWITTTIEKQTAERQAEKEEWRRWSVIEDGGSRIHAVNEAMEATRKKIGELVHYLAFLERENSDLRAENERLKAAAEATQEADIQF